MRGSGNRMRELREARKLSQRQLAEAVETSQQQIQRIEAGLQTARIDLALKIAKALGSSLENVFPGLRDDLRKRTPLGLVLDARESEELSQRAGEAGVNPDPNAWCVLCLLRGGGRIEAPIPSTDLQRLRGWLDRGGIKDGSFFTWDSKGVRLLLNLRHLLHAHFTFEPATLIPELPEKRIDLTERVRVFLADRAEPLTFEVQDYEEAGDDPPGELGDLWMEAQGELEEGQFLHFTDVNGEEVWLRAADVALIDIPLWALHPELIPDPDTGETEASTR
jgi:transcriptional regulator with XRE-family HTH domain